MIWIKTLELLPVNSEKMKCAHIYVVRQYSINLHQTISLCSSMYSLILALSNKGKLYWRPLR